MLILGGSASQPLAEKVAKELGQEAGQLDDVKDQDVVAIQSFYRTPDENIFELLLLADTLRDLGARSITTVVPYFAYTRQDSRFYPGEALSAASVARLLEFAGTTSFLTIDCHLHRLGDVAKVFKIPARNLTAMHELGKYAREHFKPHNPIVIGPDEEASQWAAVVAKELETEHTAFRKVRVRKEGMTSSKVEVDAGEINLKGRDVVFADDIISTGKTIAEASKACKKGGAKRIFVVCTHPVLAEGALNRIKAAGVLKVVGTDTYPGPTSKVSVAPVIAAALKS
jgi:ribose-phosphate pyrophosphokinase